ncbi:MAG: amino acid adenylation domain-containing protein [Clostridia bacterium]|nr:amino acid adenylation domain-containing protein [Clostridia bacterium]
MEQFLCKEGYEPIAIIGMGCRFPGGVKSPEAFWEVLKNGVDCITDVPNSRWELSEFYSANRDNPGKVITRKGGYIEGVDEFDPGFFGITPREADFMDPQQRKLLEVTWEALEDGGQKPGELAGKPVGVFIGAFTLDYKILQFGGRRHDNLAAHSATGIMMTMVSNRISYIFDFKGPSMSIDTACSSSLVAVHTACESLRRGESCLAVAGGTLLQFAPQYTIAESKGGFLSPTGWSHAFDSSANGYVRAEGVGVVVLKKLSDAVRDDDPVYAVIIGDGVNQDGHTNGITVPSGEAQQELIKEVCEKAGIQPGDLQYVEAHGTGTPVGDPIEANALGSVLGIGREPNSNCFIGSAKTNIGHTEAAAGIAGLMKVALSLKNKKIPPHLHLKELNPKIEIEKWPYKIPTSLEQWPEHQGPARAGVNSFGFGGTNSHAILQEAPENGISSSENSVHVIERPKILPLSARDTEVFPEMAKNYENLLMKEELAPKLSDIGYTLGLRREHHDQRMALIYSCKEDLVQKLNTCSEGEDDSLVIKGKKLSDEKRKLVWVFTGMGPQWWAMGRQLFEKEPVYREVIERCDKEMSKWVDWSLIKELNADEKESKMAETWLSQPANFALQIALAALWRSFGITPEAIVGHSTGEAAAFYEAGVYTLEEAVKIIISRSRLQHEVSGTGKMAAVGLPASEVEPLLMPYGDKISIAAINSPRSVTIAGNEEALNELIKPLQDRGVFCKFLQVQIPFHSAYMDPIKDELLEELKDIKPQKAKMPLYSTATGCKADGGELDASYWWKNVRGTVYFTKALDAIVDDGYSVFLEIGPHPVLAASISECMAEMKKEGRILCSLRRKEDEQQRVIASLAELYTMGFDVNWKMFYPNGKFTRLPIYPWKKDKYWVEPQDVQQRRLGNIDHPLLGRRLYATQPTWEAGMNSEYFAYLRDHQIQGNIVFPAAGYIEMALSALKSMLGGGTFAIEDLEIKKALFLSDSKDSRVQFLLDDENSAFKIVTYEDESNSTVSHANGKLRVIQNTNIAPGINISLMKERLANAMGAQECYEKLDSMGYNYKHCFRGIKELWLGNGEVLARIGMQDEVMENSSEYYFHPTITDACFQTLITAEFSKLAGDSQGAIRLPVSIERIRLTEGHTGEVWAYAEVAESNAETLLGNIYLYDENGAAIGEIKGFLAQSVDKATGNVSVNTIDSWLYEVEWQEKERTDKEEKNEKVPGKDGNGWLLFADQKGVAEELAALFREKGESCCLVQASDYFAIESDGSFATVIPDSKENVDALIKTLFKDKSRKCKGIIHLWNTEVPDIESMTIEDMQKVKRQSCYSLLNIVKAIGDSGITTKLWVITKGAQAVGDTVEDIALTASPLWGIGRVLGQQELVESWGGLIDLDPQTKGIKENVLRIFTEVSSPESDDLIAIRGEKRYVQRLSPASRLTKPLPTRYRPDGCYLITGAFGAIGQLVARMMAKHGARRLILMGRTKIPARSEWNEIEKESAAGEKIAFIRELEALGAEVLLASVDISDEAQVAEYFREFKKIGYPPIRGVVHSAGIVHDTLVSQMDTKTFDVVYDTKVYGSYLLHKYLKDEPIDYFVLFSSVAALVTTAGQTNYAAGNAFLDALAHYRRSKGLPALSVNWGPWAIGMIKELNLIEHYRTRRGMNCILPEVGMSILDRVMGQDVPQIMACEADWTRVLAWYAKEPSVFAHLAKKDDTGSKEEEVSFAVLYRNADEASKKELVEDHLADLIAKVLRCKRSQIDLHTSLNSLGLDSIMSTELRNKVALHFGHTFTIVKLLSGATVSQLAEELMMTLNESMEEEGTAASATEGGIELVNQNNTNPMNTSGSGEELRVVEEYPLSYGQKAIWFINQLLPDSPAYNIGGAMYIPAKLDIEALRKAICDIIQRHPSLRTNFFIKDGEPYQKVWSYRGDGMEVIDVQGKDWDSIREMIIDDNKMPFNLENDPLFRIRLYRQSEQDYYFAVTIYHIISDAMSNYMFIDEMQALYDQYANGNIAQLPALTAEYKDFIEWENRLINSSKGTRMFNYWRSHLPKEMPVLNLPTDKPRPVVLTNNGASYSMVISEELSRGIKELSRASGATVFMTLLSAYYALLHKYSDQEDIIIGTPVAGRTQPQFSKVYGYFVNMLPLWARFKDNPSFTALLKQVQNNVLMGLENQEYPFALLIDRLGLEHDPSRSAIFQVMFVYLVHRVEQTGMDENNVAHYAGFPMQFLQIPEEEGQYDITLSMYEENGVFNAVFKYNTDLFVESTIERMAGHYRTLLEKIVKAPEKPICTYDILTESERKLVMGSWSGVQGAYSVDECVHRLIESISDDRAEAIAVCVPMEDGTTEYLSYRDLNRKANQLARYLRRMGVKPNMPVGVCMDKSTDMIVSILAVLKSGGAYIPIDPNYPSDRIAYIIQNSGAEMVIAHRNRECSLYSLVMRVISLDVIDSNVRYEDDSNLDNVNQPGDMAYIVYTSGSTGQPKGVKVAHRSLVSIYKAWETEYRLKETTSSHLQMASFSFDVFSGDFARVLCSGGKLVLCRKEILLNIPLLYRVMVEEKVDCAEFVPSIMRNLLQYMKTSGNKLEFMNIVIVGSDVWTVNEFKSLKSYCGKNTRVINSYGLSEAAIDSTYFDGEVDCYDDGSTVPIGKPFPNTTVYIFDSFMKPVPVGIPGEMYIGGDGLAIGYVNAEKLTNERFVLHSFDGQREVRLYKTGDMAKWDERGNIHILQRMDNQVKIRGYRIELGEIEKQLSSCPGVMKAVAAAIDCRGMDKSICAYYTSEGDCEIDKKVFLDVLSEKLPGYMLPAYFIKVKEFPITPNGKIDIKALPLPDCSIGNEIIAEPQTMYEKKVAEVWKKLLGVNKVGLQHDFFSLGGNSLYLIELMIHLQNEFKISITVNQLFKASTLEGMARAIEDIVTGKEKGAEPYIIYNPNRQKVVYSFPPAGGYSLVYKSLAQSMENITLMSFNYLMEPDKIKRYADMIQNHRSKGPYVLLGYSLGGNLAFEVGKELERRGLEVTDIIIMDSYRITGAFNPTEEDMKKFEEELAEHFKKHTGSIAVQKHTLDQAKDYIDFCYRTTNNGGVKAKVHFIIEENTGDQHRAEREASWNGSSYASTRVYQGRGKHADMLDRSIVGENAKIITDIIS